MKENYSLIDKQTYEDKNGNQWDVLVYLDNGRRCWIQTLCNGESMGKAMPFPGRIKASEHLNKVFNKNG